MLEPLLAAGRGMRFTTAFLARGFQALALVTIRNILVPQNGAEQGEDAQQREERCHYSC
jgi:hypothetical protein